jgi:hypothetical protein
MPERKPRRGDAPGEDVGRRGHRENTSTASGGNSTTTTTNEDAPIDWLNHPSVKSKKVAVVDKQAVLESQQKSLVGAFGNVGVTLKQLYRLVMYEGGKRGVARGGREKQIVSEAEEAELELQRMGGGELCVSSSSSAGRGRPNVAYGVYCRPKHVEAVLGKRYKGLDPKEVVEGMEGRFAYDVLRKCHVLDMHAVLVMMEHVPLKACQQVMRDELGARVAKLGAGDAKRQQEQQGQKEQKEQQKNNSLESFVRLFDAERLKKEESFVDQKSGCIKKGTHIILSSTPKAHMVVEAVSPGPIGKRTTTILGMQKDPIVTASVFDCFVGHDALDTEGGLRCLDGLVWCANGLGTDTRTNPRSNVCEVDAEGRELFGPFTEMHHVSLNAPGVFRLEDRKNRPKNFLLNM